MEPSSWASLGAILALTFVNGFFAAAETAVVSVRPSRIRELVLAGDARAVRVQAFLDNPHRFLATIQVGITIIGFFSGAIGAVELGPELAKILPNRAASVAIVTLGAAFVSIVGGEIIPKSLSLREAERFALSVSGPIRLTSRLFAPVLIVLETASGLMLGLVGVRRQDPLPAVSSAEMRILLEQGEKHGTFEQEEVDMIHGVFELGSRTVRQVMTPRPDMVMISASAPLSAALDLAIESGFSRLPVFKETVDSIVGTVSLKDVAARIKDGEEAGEVVESAMRKPYFVPETKVIDDALRVMRENKVHMAIVVDEFGDTAGVVTIEDIIEEIVGEISDESDRQRPSFIALSPTEAVVDGTFTLADLNDEMDLAIKVDGADTVAGLVFLALGRVANEGDRVSIDGISLLVLRVDNTRIRRLKVTKVAVLHEERPEVVAD